MLKQLKRVFPFLRKKHEVIEETIDTHITKHEVEVIILTEDQFWTLRAVVPSKISPAFDENTELKDMGYDYTVQLPNKQYKRVKVIVTGKDKKRLPISYYAPIPKEYKKGKR